MHASAICDQPESPWDQMRPAGVSPDPPGDPKAAKSGMLPKPPDLSIEVAGVRLFPGAHPGLDSGSLFRRVVLPSEDRLRIRDAVGLRSLRSRMGFSCPVRSRKRRI